MKINLIKKIFPFFLLFPTQIFAKSSPVITPIILGSSSKVYQYQLKNGLKLLVVPDNRNPVATLHFILDAGSDREKKGETGLAHFFEHNMYRKTQGAPEGNYDRVLNSFGGTGNAGTSDGFVTFYSNFPSPALEPMLKLEADRFMHLDITEPYFSTEKGAVISERKMRVENNATQRSDEILKMAIEKDTPLEWMTIGSKQDVENMSLEAVKTFYHKYYVPNNTELVVGGPFKPDDVYKLVNTYFGNWETSPVDEHFHYPSSYFTRSLGKSFICSTKTMTKQISLIYPNPTLENNLNLLVYTTFFQTMLDDNKEGTFARRLLKLNLAANFNLYPIFWQNNNHPIVASFSLNSNQDSDKAKEFWLENIKEILNKPLTSKIKNQILKQMQVSDADASERMTSLVQTVIDNDFFLKNINTPKEMLKLVQQMNETKLKKWIKNTFQEKGFYTKGIVPPNANVTPCEQFLSQNK